MLKKMLKKITTMMILGLLATSTANATWIANLKVDEILSYADGSYYVRFDKKPEDTCRHWGFDFRVPADVDKKGLVFKSLTMALMTGKAVHIGYTPSSKPGTDHDSGCIPGTMALLFQVQLKK